MTRRISAALLLALAGSAFGCSEAHFFGFTPRAAGKGRRDAAPSPAPDQPAQTLAYACGDGPLAVQPTPDGRAVVALEGTLCPAAPQSVTVVIVADVSSQSGPHQDAPSGGAQSQTQATAAAAPGFDPLADGTCGRLASVQALLAGLAGLAGKDVSVGLIPFASTVDPAQVASPVPAADAAALATPARLCRSTTGGADYAAALAAAKTLLAQDHADRRILVLLTNGHPQLGQPDPVAAAVAAATSLRAAVANLTIQAVHLGPAEDPSGLQTLALITGDKHLVHAPGDAVPVADLTPPALVPETATAILAAGGDTIARVGLTEFAADGNAYRFKTAPFVLDAAVRGPLYTLTVEAAAGDASLFRTTITLEIK